MGDSDSTSSLATAAQSRAEGYKHARKCGRCASFQGPFSVTPCQARIVRFATSKGESARGGTVYSTGGGVEGLTGEREGLTGGRAHRPSWRRCSGGTVPSSRRV
jgi:hypothetical protein